MVWLYVTLPLIAVIPATIAHRKGRSFWAWWLAGVVLFIVALPASILVKPATAA